MMRLSLFHAPKWMCARTVNSVSALGHMNGTCRFHASNKRQKVLSVDNMNPYVKNMEYAVRGPIVIRAGEIEEELKKVHGYKYLMQFDVKLQNIHSLQLYGSFDFNLIYFTLCMSNEPITSLYILSPIVQNPVLTAFIQICIRATGR